MLSQEVKRSKQKKLSAALGGLINTEISGINRSEAEVISSPPKLATVSDSAVGVSVQADNWEEGEDDRPTLLPSRFFAVHLHGPRRPYAG